MMDIEYLDGDPTLTPGAISWLADLAKDARADLSQLPVHCQPIWFRESTRVTHGND